MNAFAAGLDRDEATITVTSGMLDLLDDDEVDGVIAHELGHVSMRTIHWFCVFQWCGLSDI
jgi:heat shock protein HtpX